MRCVIPLEESRSTRCLFFFLGECTSGSSSTSIASDFRFRLSMDVISQVQVKTAYVTCSKNKIKTISGTTQEYNQPEERNLATEENNNTIDKTQGESRKNKIFQSCVSKDLEFRLEAINQTRLTAEILLSLVPIAAKIETRPIISLPKATLSCTHMV